MQMSTVKCSHEEKGQNGRMTHTNKSFLCCLRCGRIPSTSSIDSSSSKERENGEIYIKKTAKDAMVNKEKSITQPLVCSRVASMPKEPKTWISSPFVTYASKTSLHQS